LCKSDDFTPNVWDTMGRPSDFQPICVYIVETVIDRDIFTIEAECKVVCAVSNSAVFDDLE